MFPINQSDIECVLWIFFAVFFMWD